MLELTKTTIDVKIGAEEFKMSAPTYEQGLRYKKEIKEAGEDEEKVFLVVSSFFESHGLPKAASSQLESKHLEMIMDALIGVKKK